MLRTNFNHFAYTNSHESNQVAPLAGCSCQFFQSILLQAAIHQPEPEFWSPGGIAGAIAPGMLHRTRMLHRPTGKRTTLRYFLQHGQGYENMARIIDPFRRKELIPHNPEVLSYYQKNSHTNSQTLILVTTPPFFVLLSMLTAKNSLNKVKECLKTDKLLQSGFVAVRAATPERWVKKFSESFRNAVKPRLIQLKGGVPLDKLRHFFWGVPSQKKLSNQGSIFNPGLILH